MKIDYGQKEDRNSRKTEVKKNGGEEKSAGCWTGREKRTLGDIENANHPSSFENAV